MDDTLYVKDRSTGPSIDYRPVTWALLRAKAAVVLDCGGRARRRVLDHVIHIR